MTTDPDPSPRPRGLRELASTDHPQSRPEYSEFAVTLPIEEPTTPVLLDDSIPEAAAPPPDSPPGLLSVGSPLFNVGLVVLLMGMSFLAVILPSRTDGLADSREMSAALAFEDPVVDAPDTTTTSSSSPPTTIAGLDNALVAELLDELRKEDVATPIANDAVDDEADAAEPDVPEPATQAAVTPTAPPQELVQVVYRTEQVQAPAPASTSTAAPSTTSTTTTTEAPLPQCSDFDIRPEAQAAFDADPATLSYFDGDGDGEHANSSPTRTRNHRSHANSSNNSPMPRVIFDSDPEGLSYLDGDGDGIACEQLPGAPVEGPELPPAAEVLSVTAVREQQGVFGLHTREAPWWMGELDYLSRLIGKSPNNLLFFQNWSTPFPAEQVRTVWGRGMTPQIAWEPIIPGADTQPTLREIADGEWDPYIDEWAAAAAAHGQPIVLRLAAEMNGNWYSWSEQLNGNNEGDFVDMWRHVYDRFELAGADNVVWLWSVNRADNLNTELINYWPGEEYTDWVGISGYWRGHEGATDPSFDGVFGYTLAEMRAITSKPILLAEIGAGTDVDADRVNWLESLFTGLDTNPDIIGFVYFNDNKAGGDWRIQFSQNMVDAFAAGVADDRWKSGALPIGMKIGERLSVPAHTDPDNQGLAE